MPKKELLKTIQRAADKGLRKLDLSNKGLTELPQEIGQLTKVTVLKLSNNKLTELPPEIGQLTNLTNLDLSENRLADLPPEIGQLANLTGLLLNNNRLTALQSESRHLANLSVLSLRANLLQRLPPQIGQLRELRSLDLSRNQLTSLPREIGRLSELVYMRLNGNHLTVLPPEIGRLTNLAELHLYSNQLTYLPSEFGNLSHLTGVDFDWNLLSDLPKEFAQLTNLTDLGLRSNRLVTFPPEIAFLSNLVGLDLSENQLTSLPPEMGRLTVLENLHLNVNPLTSPPPEIVDQGTEAILAYLREQLEESQPQWVSKLLVVGEGGVGKTALLRSLRGEKFEPELETTRGIAVEPLGLDHPSKPGVTMQLNSWDFGGQEIYHATHQFFLTNRSLFVLTWNARHGYEQSKLYYWLDAIQSRAPESPILLVATHIDERDADIPLAELHAKYPYIVGQCEISNKKGTGIAELRDKLADVAQDLPLMGEQWPATWQNAAEAIRTKEEKHITPQQLWKIMAVHKVTGDNATILAQWMHELGDILFYRDDKELNDLVILKPQWVTKYISKVLESDDVIGQDGLFTRKHMEDLWGDLPTGMRDHFLRLMERFDLSYRTLDDREISLVVERLPLDPPDYQPQFDAIKETESCHDISMKFKLNSIPAGIPTWFIARSHRFTTHTHWRTGALFADSVEKKHLALVKAMPHERYVQLTARGPNPHNFFVLLKDGIELILRRFPGLKIERTIPCLGHNGKPCSHEFKYEQLVKRLEMAKPKYTVECPESTEDVDVRTLLFGLDPSTLDDVLREVQKSSEQNEDRHRELLTLLQR